MILLKRTTCYTAALLATFLSISTFAQASDGKPDTVDVNGNGSSSDSSDSHGNALSLEVLGRGGLYSINYDHMISNYMAVGIGFSHWSFSFIDTDSITIIPIYANLYSSPKPNRAFLTAGVDVVFISETDSDGLGDGLGSFTESGAGAVLGGGYEYRGTSGFLFRAAPYLVVASGGIALTAGLSFGVTF